MKSESFVTSCAYLRVVLMVLGIMGSTGCRRDTAVPPETTPPPVRSFAVYALSRGKGVPPEAAEALRKVVALAEEDQRRGVQVSFTTKRFGLEGEARACITYEDAQAGARALESARSIVKNVDLVNLEVEPCNEEKSS